MCLGICATDVSRCATAVASVLKSASCWPTQLARLCSVGTGGCGQRVLVSAVAAVLVNVLHRLCFTVSLWLICAVSAACSLLQLQRCCSVGVLHKSHSVALCSCRDAGANCLIGMFKHCLLACCARLPYCTHKAKSKTRCCCQVWQRLALCAFPLTGLFDARARKHW